MGKLSLKPSSYTQVNIKTPEEYMREKYPVLKLNWTFNDTFYAERMKEYAEYYHQKKLERMLNSLSPTKKKCL
jgi:hypothetical protein